MSRKVEWDSATCPICGAQYQFIKGGYKPKTCPKYDCVHKYLHPEMYKPYKEVVAIREKQ